MRGIAGVAALVAVLLALVAGAALCAPPARAAASPSPAPVTYRIGIGQDCDGMNPFASWSGISWECFRLGYDFLTWYDAEYEPVPDVATAWETSEDGRTWTFHIREGMKWHDGMPLTARDVAFTYNLILDTQHWSYIQYLTGVTSVTAPDDATVVITTSEPNAGMLALYIPILPQHVWEKVDPDHLETYDNVPFVGSGPFRVTELEKSRWVKLQANPEYPSELGGAPNLDEVYFVINQNTDAMIEDYRAGSLDAVVDFPATYQKVLAEAPGTTAVAAPAVGFHELGFNCWKSAKSKGDPLLRDPVIRQAVHWAIDKKKIVATSMAGLAEPGTSLISVAQGAWHWDVPEDGQFRYDPVRAKRMLEDAGYSDRNGDGVRENATGHELSFRLVALSEYPEDQAAAKMIVSWCRDVGIELTLEQKDEGAFSDAVYDNADYDMFIWSWGGDIDPGFMLSTFTTTQIGGWGDSQYSDPEYDRLFVRQAQAFDPADPDDTTQRKAITDEMQKILYRDTPYIVLWYNLNLQAFRTDTWRGYAVAPGDDGAPFWNFMRATYVGLRPVGSGSAVEDGSAAWIWAVVAGVAAGVAVGLVVLRRRPKAVEDT